MGWECIRRWMREVSVVDFLKSFSCQYVHRRRGGLEQPCHHSWIWYKRHVEVYSQSDWPDQPGILTGEPTQQHLHLGIWWCVNPPRTRSLSWYWTSTRPSGGENHHMNSGDQGTGWKRSGTEWTLFPRRWMRWISVRKTNEWESVRNEDRNETMGSDMNQLVIYN